MIDSDDLREQVERERREQMAKEREEWIASLRPKDWLVNGGEVKGYNAEIWSRLDWSRAWMDMGFSPGGNPGPYWHVPWDDDGDELWARLYPKVLRSKWLLTIRQAAAEAYAAQPLGDTGKKAVRDETNRIPEGA